MRSSYTESEYMRVLNYIENEGINYKNITNAHKYIEQIKKMKKKNGSLISPLTVKMYLVATIWYLKKSGLKLEQQNILKNEIEKIAEDNLKDVKQHILLGNQIDNYVEWPKVLKLYETMKQNYSRSKQSHVNFVLLSCYVLIPPRRLKDYALMHVVTNGNNLSSDLNYYIRNEKIFVFNNYKTDKKYKCQKQQVPKELYQILEEYIKKYNITGSLFQLTRKAIQLRLTRIFKKGLNCSVSVNILRHSYISFGKESGEFLGEEEEYAKKMGHSVMTQLDYYKSSKKIATQKK